MTSKILEAIKIDPGILIILLFILIIVLFGLYANAIMQYKRLKNSYTTFMRGQDGKSLEVSMRAKYAQVDKVIAAVKRNHQDIEALNKQLQGGYQKMGIVKYDAFNEMGGKLSFALTMLDEVNDGWILNAMHSREGCYAYIKEVVKGESYVELADEEKESLRHAMYHDVSQNN
jgi:methionyl-tRNA synthetase